MRLYNYLNESRSKTIGRQEVIDYITTSYNDAFERYKREYYIWRATGNLGPHAITKSTGKTKPRRSANTKNYYTLVINNHQSWAKFPTREIICAGGSGERARRHGLQNIYIVLPINGAKIGICPQDDIWRSFMELRKHGIRNMHFFNSIFMDLDFLSNDLENNLENYYEFDDLDWQKFQRQTKSYKIEDILHDLYHVLKMSPIIDENKVREMFESYKDVTLYDWMVDIMNPKKNDFKVQEIDLYSVGTSMDVEVWTDTDCLLIYKEELDKIIEEL